MGKKTGVDTKKKLCTSQNEGLDSRKMIRLTLNGRDWINMNNKERKKWKKMEKFPHAESDDDMIKAERR